MTKTTVLLILAASLVFILLFLMRHYIKTIQELTEDYMDALEENSKLKEEIRQLKSPSSPSSEH